MQREFRISWLAAGLLLASGILLFRAELNHLPNRAEIGPQTISLQFEAFDLSAGSVGPFQVVGAWRLFAADSRFGGVSGLAIDQERLTAITDSGVAIRFGKPSNRSARATLRELPDGPGQAGFKVNRDSEALIADPGGRGWWVAFENRDELWLYDRGFTRGLGRTRIDSASLGRNRGIEGMVSEGNRLLLFPERGGRAIMPGGAARPISGVRGWLSEAVLLPDERLLVVNRSPTPIGLRNDLVELVGDRAGYRAVSRWRIPVGRLDNVEALAAESLPGGVRLWMMTDNNFRQHQPTLLIALELRKSGSPGR